MRFVAHASLAVLALVVAAGIAVPLLRATPTVAVADSGVVRLYALEAVAVACDVGDGLCLAYNGTIPGPTLEADVGDTLLVTLTNRVADTIGALAGDPVTKARLAQVNVSLHVHGMSVSPSSDGVMAMDGTTLVDSFAPPRGSYTYRWHATSAGIWHFHDHVVGGHESTEGLERGLFALVVVHAPGETPAGGAAAAFLTDEGINLREQPNVPDITSTSGTRFEFRVVAHGSLLHTFRVTNPQGVVSFERQFGPGESAAVVLAHLSRGTYEYRSIGWPIADDDEFGRLVVS